MKYISILFSLFITSTFILQAQTPQLVADFNQGNTDAFSQHWSTTAYVGEKIVLTLTNATAGEELGIIDNGNLSILKDINPGESASTPHNFISFKNEVYFTAQGENGWGVWKTDGTEVGTVNFFQLPNGNRPGGYIVSKSGLLYFTYEGTLYQTDGVDVTEITSGIAFTTEDDGPSRNYSTFNSGIAFVRNLEASETIQLLMVSENGLDTLGEIAGASRFADFYGLGQIKDGLFFLLSDSFRDELNGAYVYNEGNATITKIIIDGHETRVPVLIDYNDDFQIVSIPNKGFYSISSDSSPAQLIFEIDPDFPVQGQGIAQAKIGGKVLFHAEEDFGFDGEAIVLSDGTPEGTSKVFSSDEQFIQNIIGFNNYGFVAAGTSNGFDPQLYSVNVKSGEVQNLYNFPESSLKTESVILLGVQNSQLYFASNLDAEVGREIYFIALNLPDLLTSTKQVSSKYAVNFTSDGFEVQTTRHLPMQVQIFDLLGRNISTINTHTNTFTAKIPSKEILVYLFEIEGQQFAHKVYRH